MRSRYSGKAILVSIDPRFVVEFRLNKDVEGVGKKDEVVAFLLHSPARELGVVDSKGAVGTTMKLRLGKLEKGRTRMLRRIREKMKKVE